MQPMRPQSRPPAPFYAPQMFPSQAIAPATLMQAQPLGGQWVNPYITRRPQVTCPGMPYASPARVVRERGPYFLHHLTGVLAFLEQWIPSQQVLAAMAAELAREQKTAETRTLLDTVAAASFERDVALGVIRRMLCGDLGPGALRTLAFSLHQVERAQKRMQTAAQEAADKAPQQLRTVAESAAHLVMQSQANASHAAEVARAFIPEPIWRAARTEESET